MRPPLARTPDIRSTYPAARQIQSGSWIHSNQRVFSRHANREFIPGAGC
jgi:hypothetical protein